MDLSFRSDCLEKLLQPHESKSWNPLIATAFYRRGLIEAWGRGILKIAQLLREASLPQTVTRVDAGSVRMMLNDHS
ncbi:ATP-binding protein [Pelodictyon luteolum]|uniref:ATP-binding protein n=1 Tax=Pelodictyon luteolum TaxID=1100 RepID=UPI000319F3A2|nr:ATP-binding protein [Pelodictyon luteolum]